MRHISSNQIAIAVEKICAESNYELPKDILLALDKALKNEEKIAKSILKDILKNAQIAKDEKIPLCQDTGTANFFVKLGKDVIIDDDSIYNAINKGVAQSYKNNYLRKSVVSDPLERKNTNDNTPANIYIDIVDGEKIGISFLAKGGGSENASALKMLVPSAGWQGVKDFVISAIKDKGANACPPLIVGVAIGGDFASVGLIAKKSLLRDIGSKNSNPFYAKKEQELLEEINKLGIGAMGLGGNATALAVFIETKPTHIASLPVAVSIQCHSSRHSMVVL